jgi:probable HAF family extracellular repeat protein/T5SS/PEP-CTERM-associated repeat protein
MAAEALAVVPALTPARVRKRSMRRYLLPMLLIIVLLGSTGAAGRPPAARAGNAEAALPAGPSTAPRYTITDLGTLGGGITKGTGVNEHGQVVGPSQLGNYFYAFLWDDGSMTNLGALAGLGSWAHDINNAGQVVGVSQLSNGNSHAFRWQNGAMQDLGTLGGPISAAFDVNSAGDAAGYAWNGDGLQHAVLWGSGGIVDLGDLGSQWPATSLAMGINDARQVVGGSYNDAGEFHAFRWQNGGMQDLGTLGGDTGTAMAINEAGQVVGASRPAGSIPVHAFLWDGGMQDLGALGWNQSIAYDINEKEQVVGALQSGQSSHAFVWANGQMQDLNGLIPANSGWVLSEAHAINDKGQITGFGTVNGQTRAFLLKPNAYHWINPAGGAWHLTTNWDPQGDPGEGDVVIFDLNGQYTVNASALDASPATFLVDRMVISSTATVNFNNLNLNLVSDSPEEPSLQVNDNGIANVNSGTATFSHAIVGGLTPLNPANPPIARLQVFNNGTGLNGMGRLTIGDDGPGELFVANGGHLTSTEARLGGLLPNTTGAAVVGGNGSLWETGNIAVGYGVSGTLTVENGGRVDSNDAYVSFGVLSADSAVTVEGSGPGAGQASMWALNGSLTVGQSWFGSVEMLNGGDLFVSQDATIKNGSIRVDGRHANGDPSELNVLGNLFIGGPGSPNLLAFWREAEGNIEGNLHIGKDGPGALGLWGQGQLANATKLEVDDLLAGLCQIGREYNGALSMDAGGHLRCRDIQLGQAGTSGSGSLFVDGGMVRALDVLRVGSVGGGSGQVTMMNSALVATEGTYIAPNGVISGSGTLAVDTLGLHNDGTLSPGIIVVYPRASDRFTDPAAPAPDAAATLALTGRLITGPTGRLEIPLAGRGPGQYGSLSVTGQATLDGVLALEFQNGYVPYRNDTFTLLTATGGLTGAFDSVAISGLPPGHDSQLTIVNGQVRFKSLDGPPRRTFLPLVRRRR